MSTSTTNIANKPQNSTYSAASAGKSESEDKFASKLKMLDPNSKVSVMEFIKMDVQNYNHASKKLKKDKDIVHLVCDIDPTLYTTMTEKAQKIAKEYLKSNSDLQKWGLI